MSATFPTKVEFTPKMLLRVVDIMAIYDSCIHTTSTLNTINALMIKINSDEDITR